MSILVGDAETVLKTLPDASAQTCVTSPPYFGLRDYGVEGQIGTEETPDEYVSRLVDVFAEVRRVLKDDGTLWVNLGDSYAGARGGRQGSTGQFADRAVATARVRNRTRRAENMKPKDLMGIPWMVAFALRDDGWYLRMDVIWHKPNPMPESVQDRPTKAHEYVFLLSKSDRYLYNAEAIAEDATGRKPGNVTHKGVTAYAEGDKLHRTKVGLMNVNAAERRNRRSVWTISTQAFPEAHFATFPEELPGLCILASSSVGDTVIDPFCGSGTTCAVADAHQRRFVGIELNPEYAAMARRRVERDGAPLFSGL